MDRRGENYQFLFFAMIAWQYWFEKTADKSVGHSFKGRPNAKIYYKYLSLRPSTTYCKILTDITIIQPCTIEQCSKVYCGCWEIKLNTNLCFINGAAREENSHHFPTLHRHVFREVDWTNISVTIQLLRVQTEIPSNRGWARMFYTFKIYRSRWIMIQVKPSTCAGDSEKDI